VPVCIAHVLPLPPQISRQCSAKWSIATKRRTVTFAVGTFRERKGRAERWRVQRLMLPDQQCGIGVAWPCILWYSCSSDAYHREASNEVAGLARSEAEKSGNQVAHPLGDLLPPVFPPCTQILLPKLPPDLLRHSSLLSSTFPTVFPWLPTSGTSELTELLEVGRVDAPPSLADDSYPSCFLPLALPLELRPQRRP
jgi:hypothetical protein